MPLFGAHMSIAGGAHHAVEEAVARGCDTVQLFTKAPSNWAAKPSPDDDISLFRAALKSSGLRYPMAHDSYLITLASPDEKLYRRSVEAFIEEIGRAERLG